MSQNERECRVPYVLFGITLTPELVLKGMIFVFFAGGLYFELNANTQAVKTLTEKVENLSGRVNHVEGYLSR